MILCDLLSVRACADVHRHVRGCALVCVGAHGCVRVCADVHGCALVCVGEHECARVCACVHGCARVCACVCGYVRLCAWVCVGMRGYMRVCAGVLSNNYEFSEYLLETKVFMKWPLVRILHEFFCLFLFFWFWPAGIFNILLLPDALQLYDYSFYSHWTQKWFGLQQ